MLAIGIITSCDEPDAKKNFTMCIDEEMSMLDEIRRNEIKILATNYNMTFQVDVSKLLDKNILLNTYMASYFFIYGVFL